VVGFGNLATNPPRHLTTGHFLTDSHSSMASPARAFERRRRRSNDIRDRILNAAVELFAQRGIVPTRVESITEAADVAKGTFFNYFPTKEAIAAELAKRLMTDLWIVAQRARQAESVRPIVEALPDVFFDAMHGSPVLCRSVLGSLLLNDSLASDAAEIETSTIAHLAYILERGQELGEIRTDRAAAVIALALQQALWGALVGWRDGLDIRARMRIVLEVFWNGAAVAASDVEDWGV
jgi:AcrR family transcriptional regulator